MLSSRTDVSETLAPLDLDAYALDAALRKALKLSERWLAMPPVELKSLVQEIVDRITVGADRIEIQLSRAKIAAALQVGERGHVGIAQKSYRPINIIVVLVKLGNLHLADSYLDSYCRLEALEAALSAAPVRIVPWWVYPEKTRTILWQLDNAKKHFKDVCKRIVEIGERLSER